MICGYIRTGSTKIPYDKREMKAELGEKNLFTDSQSDIKNWSINLFSVSEKQSSMSSLLSCL